MHFFIWFVTIMRVRVCSETEYMWSVRASVTEHASVFVSHVGNNGMCTTSVSTYLLSSVCFKWHMCIVNRHNYLRGADKQPNMNTVVCFWIPGSVDCSD